MEKPKKRQFEPHYDYNDLAEYVSQKLGKNLWDYAGKFKTNDAAHINSTPYLDFWHWLIKIMHNSIYNRSFFYMPLGWWGWENDRQTQSKPDDPSEMWIWEILQVFGEFADSNGDLEVWIEW